MHAFPLISASFNFSPNTRPTKDLSKQLAGNEYAQKLTFQHLQTITFQQFQLNSF